MVMIYIEIVERDTKSIWIKTMRMPLGVPTHDQLPSAESTNKLDVRNYVKQVIS